MWLLMEGWTLVGLGGTGVLGVVVDMVVVVVVVVVGGGEGGGGGDDGFGWV